MKEKLQETIGLILEAHGGKIHSKTKLVKILYLLERYYAAEYRQPLLNLSFKSYFYGPYTEEIEEALSEMEENGYIRVSPVQSYITGNKYYNISLIAIPDYGKLSREDRKVIRNFIRERNLVNRSLDDILDEVYETEEYKRTPFGEVIDLQNAS